VTHEVEFGAFRNQRVIVTGASASATDIAATASCPGQRQINHHSDRADRHGLPFGRPGHEGSTGPILAWARTDPHREKPWKPTHGWSGGPMPTGMVCLRTCSLHPHKSAPTISITSVSSDP